MLNSFNSSPPLAGLRRITNRSASPIFSASMGPASYEQSEPEFGTNTGRQGIFDPDNQEHYQKAINRLQQLETEYGPRLAMKYTGDTGLAKNDATGYAKMLNARTEAANIRNILGGKGPMNIQYGGVMKNETPDYRPTWNPLEGQESAVATFERPAEHKPREFRRRQSTNPAVAGLFSAR